MIQERKIIEAVKNINRRAYARYEQACFADEKRAAMQDFYASLQSLQKMVGNDNVVKGSADIQRIVACWDERARDARFQR